MKKILILLVICIVLICNADFSNTVGDYEVCLEGDVIARMVYTADLCVTMTVYADTIIIGNPNATVIWEKK